MLKLSSGSCMLRLGLRLSIGSCMLRLGLRLRLSFRGSGGQPLNLRICAAASSVDAGAFFLGNGHPM